MFGESALFGERKISDGGGKGGAAAAGARENGHGEVNRIWRFRCDVRERVGGSVEEAAKCQHFGV